ncbi:MAG TPA: HNH endonuclease signature motif containing protein [Isosphaeraceae bacterium]|nr:HNH endonuclease signature motif containing protein [Isosphaeraceae bacterium]
MNRPPIPPDIAHQLRREAGFGCCKCGRPIYVYHHIVEWKDEHHYRAEDMMILCPYCHEEATQGAMKETEQRQLKADPRNIRKGYVEGLLKINAEDPCVELANVRFCKFNDLIIIDDEPIISLGISEEGGLEISLSLYDRLDRQVLRIDRNQWLTTDSFPWDIKSKFQYLEIRHKKSDILLRIDAKSETPVITGCLRKGGTTVRMTEQKIKIDSHLVKNVVFRDGTWIHTAIRIWKDQDHVEFG